MRRIHTSYWHYGILVAMLAFLALLFVTLREQEGIERIIVMLAGGFYFGWGMLHHILDRDWHIKILLEYLAFAIIGTLILLNLVNRW